MPSSREDLEPLKIKLFRQQGRVNVIWGAQLSTEGSPDDRCEVMVLDIGLGGASLGCARSWSPGARLILALIHPQGGDAMDVPGSLKWCGVSPENDGFRLGVAFDELSGDEAERLVGILAMIPQVDEI